jgi:ribose 5-phosphate isomerase B
LDRKRIAIGSDHRGFALKEAIVPLLAELGHQHLDLGCHDGSSVDYPDIAERVATAVAKGEANCGVLICGTGIGMSITANKVPGIRAALCSDPMSAKMAREHNDANVLCMGGAMIGEWLAREITLAYLTSEFEGGRHARRVAKISRLESGSQLKKAAPGAG